jgi:hypothetical protein
VWHDEPGTYPWTIARIPDQQHKICVSIEECFAIDSNRPHTLTFIVKLKLFCIVVLRQMQKIRDMMREESYREHRDEFPHSEFARFERVFEKTFR